MTREIELGLPRMSLQAHAVRPLTQIHETLSPLARDASTDRLERLHSAPPAGAATSVPEALVLRLPEPRPRVRRRDSHDPALLQHLDRAAEQYVVACAALRDAFPKAHHISVSRGAQGLSGMASYKAWVDGVLYHCKLAPPRDDERLSVLRREIRVARQVAAALPDVTLAPVYFNEWFGALITPHCTAIELEHAARPPFRAKHMQTLSAMHRATRKDTWVAPDVLRDEVQSLVVYVDTLRAAITPVDADDAAYLDRCHAQAVRAAKHLESMPYRPCFGHGDPHPGNFVFHEGNALLIDWDHPSYRDNMHNVAYFAFHVGASTFSPSEHSTLLAEYAEADSGPADPTARSRYETHLVYMHAMRYLQQRLGVPWKDDVDVLRNFIDRQA